MIDNHHDLSLLKQLFTQALDLIAEVRDVTSRQQTDIADLSARMNRFENELPSLRYQASRAEELEYLANPYSCDGEALCNINGWLEDE
jgi:hypothetical protein